MAQTQKKPQKRPEDMTLEELLEYQRQFKVTDKQFFDQAVSIAVSEDRLQGGNITIEEMERIAKEDMAAKRMAKRAAGVEA